MSFGSFGAGFGSFGAGVGGLLPVINDNLKSWLRIPTADGKTLANSQGASVNLKNTNCIKTDNSSSHTATMSTGQIFTTGSVFSADILVHGSTGGSNRHALLGSSSVNGCFVILGNVPKFRTNGLVNDLTFSTLTVSDNVNYNIKYERTSADTLVCTLTNLDTGAVASETGTLTTLAQNSYMNSVTLNRIGTSGSVYSKIKFTNVVYNNWKYPLQEGSGTRCFDIGGEGNHITLGADIWDTENSRASHNHEYGFSGNAVFDGIDDYIETGVVANDNYTLEFRAKLENDNAYMGSFNLVDRFFIGRNTSSVLRLGYKSFNNTASVSSSIYSKLTTYKIQGGKGFVDGVEVINSGVSPTGATVGELYVGARNLNGTADSFVQADLEYYRIYDDSGVLVRDFVPSSNGLYDKVNGVYYSNDGTGTTTVKRIPALNTKTTQVATFDGTADLVDFGTHAIPASDSIEVVFTPQDEADSGIVYSMGRPSGGSGFGIKWDGTNDRISFRTADVPRNNILNLVTSTNSCVADGTTYKVTYDYDSSAGTATLVLFNADTGATIETESATGVATAAFDVGSSRPLKIGADQFNLDDYLGTIHSVKSSFIDVDFQANIGATTVIDNSGNGNNGTVTVGSGGTATFWGTRVADTAGSLVSADYATGNTTISNPAGFVHNGSECGFETGLQELTSTQIFAIDNNDSGSQQLFIRKDNGNVTQFLEYEANLTGTDLTRTRAYVG